MKIKGELDAAVWFDMLSILEVKLDRIRDLEKHMRVTEEYKNMLHSLEISLSPSKLKEILWSMEYRNLYTANSYVFKMVDFAEDENKKDQVSAYQVAQLNLLRYKCKNELQKKFFESEVSEVKTGV